MSNNLKRVLTSVVAVPVILGLAYVGGWPFAAVVAGIGVLGQRELYRMARQVGARPARWAGYAVGILVVASLVWPHLWPLAALALLVFVLGASVLMAQEHFLQSFTVTIAGVLYPTGLLGSLVWLRQVRSSFVDEIVAFQLVLLTLLLVWATDVAAYYVGRQWGRRPLAPVVSPNKTWEGAIGGLGAAVLMGVGLRIVWVDVLSWEHLASVIVIAGVCGQLGDLLESRLKRSTDRDDSSTLIPGHGGVLDRFDAMAVVAPLIVLYLDHVAGLF